MLPVEVVPSPQSIVAMKSLAGSTPLAWVNVATCTLLWFLPLTVIGPETTIGGSATAVVTTPVLLTRLLSDRLLVTEAVFGQISIFGRLCRNRSGGRLPNGHSAERELDHTTTAQTLPWLRVDELYARFAPSVSVSTTLVALVGP